MADFTDAFLDLLPENCNLRKVDNKGRVVIDRTVGEYIDNLSDISDKLFLTSASGGWLDAFGRDYGIARKINESDDDYRERIIFEKLEYFNARNLINVFGLSLFGFVDGFDASENTLTSDNPFLSSRYMSIADDELRSILNKKFVLDDEIVWLVCDKIAD